MHLAGKPRGKRMFGVRGTIATTTISNIPTLLQHWKPFVSVEFGRSAEMQAGKRSWVRRRITEQKVLVKPLVHQPGNHLMECDNRAHNLSNFLPSIQLVPGNEACT